MALFAFAGIGNGSTFRMIPVIFLTRSCQRADRNDRDAQAAVP
jgi:nitrate/nitrite transporter NarK